MTSKARHMETSKTPHPAFLEFKSRKIIYERQKFLKETVTVGSKFYCHKFKKEDIVTRRSDDNVWFDGVRHSWSATERLIRKGQLEFIWIA